MPGTHWGELEDLLVHQIVVLKLSLEEVEIPGKSQNAIRAKAHRLSLITPQPPREKWSKKQIATLRRLQRLGYSARDVFRSGMLGEPYRSLNAIRKEWGRKKLSDKKRRRAGQKRKVWNESDLRSFKKYLYENSGKQTPEQIARQWGLARSTVARWQSLLGLKLPRQVVMQLPYSVAKQKRGKRRGLKKYLTKRAIAREEKRIRLTIEANKIMGENPSRRTRVCEVCCNPFPLNPKFFHYSERPANIGLSGTGRRRIYKRTCRMCVNDIQRRKSASA